MSAVQHLLLPMRFYYEQSLIVVSSSACPSLSTVSITEKCLSYVYILQVVLVTSLAAYCLLQDGVMSICIIICIVCIISLGFIISLSPLDDLKYHGWSIKEINFTSPYTSPVYLGWAIASIFALLLTGILPAVAWFATYRFSLSSATCVAVFTGKTCTVSCFVSWRMIFGIPVGESWFAGFSLFSCIQCNENDMDIAFEIVCILWLEISI